jgi:hypothetical protein
MSLATDIAVRFDAIKRRSPVLTSAFAIMKSDTPRLSAWEDTVDAGFVRNQFGPDIEEMVVITDRGKEILDANQRIHA